MLPTWLSSVPGLFSRRRSLRAAPRRRRPDDHQPERLEDRRVMAFDLVSAYVTASDAPFYKAGGSAETITEAPQQLTLRFSPGVKIDASTLGTISIVRSGGDALGNATDTPVVPGSIFVNDVPNQNEVVIRFADTLPDDLYRIKVNGGASGLKAEGGDTMTAARTIDVRLDLGAFVVSVVPQPVSRSGATLTQSRNTIDVYFNKEDALDPASAQTREFYRLFEVDAATGDDVSPLAPITPTAVTYVAATGKATLTFADLASADGKLFRLQVGGVETLVAPAAPEAENGDENSSFTTAQDLGTLTAAGATITGAITRLPSLPTPAGKLEFPMQPGTIDEPGHRDTPADSGEHGLPEWMTLEATGASVGYYNFKSNYGANPQGNPLFNAITENQKQRAREVFELFSRYTGCTFIETEAAGLTVVTGDVRAAEPTVPPTAVAGIGGGGLAIMNSLYDWGASEYGGKYFEVAMHEIGHALGLQHSYDLPSIMGAGLPGEKVYPGDYDTVHLRQLFPADGADVDVYKFALTAAGKLSAETVVARPGEAATSLLDSVLTLYREKNGTREIVARNDDYYGRDSFIGLDLEPGTYFLAVSSKGNTAFTPEVSDSGSAGKTEGDYRLDLRFSPKSTSATTIVDTTGKLLDGDRDGKAGGAFSFWFKTASEANTVFVDKAAAAGGTGARTSPYNTIQAALANAGSRSIIRIVGNAANTPYLVGTDLGGGALPDGDSFNIPQDKTVMIDAGAIIKLRSAIIDVGSSSPLVARSGAALQVLGTPGSSVFFTSYHDDSVGGDSDNVGPAAVGGQWGGIVLRADSDFAASTNGAKTAFVNSISQARITYGGGQVVVDSQRETYAPIQLESARPTIAFNTITDSAGPAISATPNSFEDSNGRIGPEIRGNRLAETRNDGPGKSPLLHQNSINGLFVKIRTAYGSPIDTLDVPARLRSSDIVYVLQENLLINGGVGGLDGTSGVVEARRSGRLAIDPGVVVKLQGSRIELGRGTSQLIAEGTPGSRVVFTSLGDNRFGAGGTFDTNGNLPDVRVAGDWGGIVLNAGATASIDHAYIAFGGGQTPIEGGFDGFNVVETHQGDLRLAHSRIENNAAGAASSNRAGRGGNAAATIFVRGAQPVILDNDFRDNLGAVVSVNANSLTDREVPDPGRSTGPIDRDARHDDNRGPLVRGNRLSYAVGTGRPAGGAVGGLQVRGEQITVESVWDDTDVVHVLQNEIVVQNFHTATGIRLVSRPDASLVVKLQGVDAGFTAAGYGLDIDDRIGGTVQVVGQPGYPVVLTALADDTIGASLDPLGRIVKDTGNDGASTPAAGAWRSLKFLPYSNDRNVAIVLEAEKSAIGTTDANGTAATAQSLGVLAPNLATANNSWESAQEKSGDENRRLGFEVHGRIATDNVGDVDVYTFEGYPGSEAWIDVDKTTGSLDTMVELLDAAGNVLARSADGQTDSSLAAATLGIAQPLSKDGWRGGDYYTLNPRDPGMRVVLPSRPGQPAGTLTRYYIRVRSQPRSEPVTVGGVTATPQVQYEADLADPAKVKAGATSGAYELRVRLRQRDEKPGSTVRYADIRYPTTGIDVQGLPRSSLFTGESGESSTVNDTFTDAQYVGNLLQADRNTISIAGAISAATDVDWYTFALNYEQIQAIGGVNNAFKSWATVFDLDYGDGVRGDLTLSVFDSQGRLLYVGRDSDVASDQPGVGQGTDFDDVSRGSAGKLDPFIGTVQMPAGNPTGGGSIEGGQPITPPDPSKQLRYYVAVSSNQRLPAALDAFFKEAATNTRIRLEPVNSVTRIAEDHIGFSGYRSGPDMPGYPVPVPPQQSLFDINNATSLSLNVTPFTLSDVTLFVYTGTTIETVDAMRGGNETTLYRLLTPPVNPTGDITMRTDGKLFQYKPGSNAGMLYSVDTVTGGTTLVGDDNIPEFPPDPPLIPQITALTDTIANRTSFPLPEVIRAGSLKGELNVSYSDTTGASEVTRRGSWTFTQAANGTLTFTPIQVDGNTPEIDIVNTRIDTTAKPDAPFGVLTIAWTSKYVPVPDASVNLLNVEYKVENRHAVTTKSVDALAYRRLPNAGTSYQLYYSVRDANGSRLYRGAADTGDAATGRIGEGTEVIGLGAVGTVTGLAFVNGLMYGVDTGGNFFSFDTDLNGAPILGVTVLSNVPGANFQGLAAGPANLQNGAFSNMLFAITGDGVLYALDAGDGSLQQVFDSDGDGVADATSINTGAIGAWSGVLGLAFSPLDVNLWHPTTRRGKDGGHGVNDALDETRNTVTGPRPKFEREYVDAQGHARKFLDAEGAVSMYFGLEKYVQPVGDTVPPYLNYQSEDGQFGVVNGDWQKDLTSDATAQIADTYNLPGGAYGSLVTNEFSLGGSGSTDKPTLYFNYWLQTQNASSAYDRDDMRDSARVFISVAGGPWQVVASNNSNRSLIYTSDGELPNFVSASSALTTADNQHVQELYDAAEWRQARVDLGKWAGQTNLRLRFDFSTAGEFDATQRDASGNLLNDIFGYAGETGDFRGNELKSRERGQDNAHEGFYVDDVIIGYAERGEMVTGATAAQTTFFDIATPKAKPDFIGEQSLTGPYQLEIRRGTEYGGQPSKTLDDVGVYRTFDTNHDLVRSNGGLGDANLIREQGRFLIENNIISDASGYGISIDAAARDAGTNAAVPGTPANLPVLNASRLVPGVVVTNNVISTSGVGGILLSGDTTTKTLDGTTKTGTAAVTLKSTTGLQAGMLVTGPGIPADTRILSVTGQTSVTLSQAATADGADVALTFAVIGPAAAVPFGRIVNNTIYGGPTAKGIGIDVTENAGPTILNNLFANLTTGVKVDASSQANTVIGTSAFYGVSAAGQVTGATQSGQIALAADPFVNAAGRNFYLAAGSAAIDSSANSLLDRPAMVAVASPIGIPESPILAPERDLFGQLRGDDPDQASVPGLGSNVFKDRGAIDRIDFTRPYARIAVPLDNSVADQDSTNDRVVYAKTDARGITRFEIQLDDVGVGIDKAKVAAGAFQVRHNGKLLEAGTGYVFNYLETSNRVVFESPAVFAMGTYEITVSQTTGGTPVNALSDLAGNPLLANKADGTTTFTIVLVDVPSAPTGLAGTSGDSRVSLTWTAAASDGSPLLRYAVQYATNPTFTGAAIVPAPATSVSTVVSSLVNGTSYWFRIRAVNDAGVSEWSNVVGPVVPLPIPTFSLAADTGSSGTDGVTSNPLVNVTGILPGATWEFTVNGGAGWTAGTGSTFSLPANATYATGAVRVRQTSGGTVSGEFSNAAPITIDTLAPAAAPVTTVTDDVPPITGNVPAGGVTNDPTLGLAGTTAPGTTVEIYDGATKLGSATVAGTAWSFTTTKLADGGHAFRTRTIDLAGNVGPFSADRTVTIDTAPPAAPTVDPLTTADARPRLTGTATLAAGESLSVAVNGFTFANVPVVGGKWTLDTATAASTPAGFAGLLLGTYSVTATVVDAAGNSATDATTDELAVVDLTPPTIVSFGSTTANGSYRAGAVINITATASEAIRNGSTFTATLNTGAVVTLVKTGARTLSGSYTVQAGQNAVRLTVTSFTAGQVRDVAGNLLTSTIVPGGAQNIAGAKAITVDTARPTVSITSSTTILAAGGTAIITFQLREASTNFTAADVSSSGGTLSGFTKLSPTLYQATFTPVSNATTTGTVSVPASSFTDAAGNPNIAATITTPIAIDTVIRARSPGFGTSVANAPAVAAQVLSIPITFSAPVSNVTLKDFTLLYASNTATPLFRSLALTGASVAAVNPVNGSSTTWVLSLPATTTSFKGIYRLDVGGPQSGILAGGLPVSVASSLFWKWL